VEVVAEGPGPLLHGLLVELRVLKEENDGREGKKEENEKGTLRP
jgi:hypothetical protein